MHACMGTKIARKAMSTGLLLLQGTSPGCYAQVLSLINPIRAVSIAQP